MLIVLAAKGKLKKKKKAKKQKLDKEDDVESGPGYSSVYSPIEVAESQLGSKNNSKSTEMRKSKNKSTMKFHSKYYYMVLPPFKEIIISRLDF